MKERYYAKVCKKNLVMMVPDNLLPLVLLVLLSCSAARSSPQTGKVIYVEKKGILFIMLKPNRQGTRLKKKVRERINEKSLKEMYFIRGN